MQVVAKDNIDYQKIRGILISGGTIIYPTDTAYALGCDAGSDRGVESIFRIKQRTLDMALPLIASDCAMVEQYAVLNDRARELVDRYWPGPLTLVLPARGKRLCASVLLDDTIAVRVPNSVIARDIARSTGGPIVSTSANMSGGNTPYSLKDVQDSLGEAFEEVAIVIDGGTLPAGPVSTIVKVCDTMSTVIRKGTIAIDQ